MKKQIIERGYLTYALTNGEKIFGIIKDHYVSDWSVYYPLYWSEVFVDGNLYHIHRQGMLLVGKTNEEISEMLEQSKVNLNE